MAGPIDPIINPVINPKEGLLSLVAANPLGFLFTRIWITIVIVGAIAMILYLVWGGMDWLMSEGDKEKIAGARNKITHALVGLGLLVLSFAIVIFLRSAFGLDLLKLKWPAPDDLNYTPPAECISPGGDCSRPEDLGRCCAPSTCTLVGLDNYVCSNP